MPVQVWEHAPVSCKQTASCPTSTLGLCGRAGNYSLKPTQDRVGGPSVGAGAGAFVNEKPIGRGWELEVWWLLIGWAVARWGENPPAEGRIFPLGPQ